MFHKSLHSCVWALSLFAAVCSGQTTFSNTTTIGHAAAAGGSTSPNPNPTVTSTIAVSGMTGTVSKVTVTIPNLQVDVPTDIDMVLIGPNGQNLVFMSDVGGTSAFSGSVTWDDTAAGAVLTQGTALTAGSHKPSDDSSFNDRFNTAVCSGLGTLSQPAGQGTATFATQFGGINPNGTWRLCVADDALGPTPGSVGVQLTGGWQINVTTVSAAGTTTTVSSNLNPSFTGNLVTLTATVVKTADGLPVNAGTVTFLDGATPIASNVAVNGSGQASTSTTTLVEGAHTITAQYTGTASFNNSSGTLSQVVNNATVVTGNQYCNPGTITLNTTVSGQAATVYPSRIFVSGVSGTISKVTLTMNGISATQPDDWEWLVVGPTSNKLVFWNDAGGFSPISGVNATFDDAAASALPDATAFASGTYRPTAINSTAASFPSPAPALSSPSDFAAPFGAATFANKFGGSNPNGTWTLYGVDDALGGGSGTIGSWCLTILTNATEAPTTTIITSSTNPSFTGGNVTFTATVTNTSTAAAVTSGTVTFKEGATVLAGPTALNGLGQASFSKADLTEGAHVITAEFSGVPGSFAISNGSMTQTVNNATVITGGRFCNPGPLNIPTNGPSSQYPSRIFVTGLGGSVTKVTMELLGLSNNTPENLDFLLAAPNGNNLVVMSDVGGTTAVASQNLTLDDAAASALPDNTALTGGTYRPTDHSAIADNFPAPAPGAIIKSAPQGAGTFASQFNGLNGADLNGTWSLYTVVDAIGTPASAAAQGWCLNITTTSDLTISKSHTGDFSQGQTGAQYTITVSNAAGSGTTSGTVTIVDTLPAGLTATAISGTGWSCTLATLTCTRNDALVSGGSYPAITLTVNVAANAPASVTNSATVSGGGDGNGANNTANDVTNVAALVPITFTTSPAGRSFSVNGTPYTSAQTLSFLAGSTVTVATTSPQAGGVGTQYVFADWSDAGAISHTYTIPASATTLTANFTTQYQLTTTAGAGGTISPASGFVNAGTVVNVSATPNAGFTFANFTGDLTGSTNPQSLTVDGPKSVTANFTGTATTLNAGIATKVGPANARVWTFAITNTGSGTAVNAQLNSLALTQVAGAACTPVITSALPSVAGTLAASASGSAPVTIDFSSCPVGARFSAQFSYSANGGAVTGNKTIGNQFQ